MRNRRALCLAALLLLLLAVSPASAQPAYAGPEIWLAPSSPVYGLRAAGHPGGGFTLVWRALRPDPSGAYPFHARRFAADGAPLTGEIAVGVGSVPGITAVGQGFIVFGLRGGLARRFDASGRPAGDPFPVAGSEAAADVQGNFATAAVSGTGLSLFRFSAAGQPRGETAVPLPPGGYRWAPTVARAPRGEMLVVWQEGQYGQVFGQRFGRFGDRVGSVFQIGGGTPADSPVIAAAADGSFLVAWLGWAVEDVDPPDPSYGIWARLYDAAGRAQGEPFRIGQGVGDEIIQQLGLAPGPWGSFLAVWAGRFDVHLRQVYADGSLSPETATRRGRFPAAAPVAAASWGAGDLAVAWTRGSVAIQRFATDASPGALRFALGRYVGTAGGGTLPIQVERREGNLGAVSATYTLRGPSVPTGISGTVTFAAGDSTPKVLALALPDALASGEETWLLTLSAPTGGAILGSPARARIEVRDSAAPSPLLAGAGTGFIPKEPSEYGLWTASPSVAVLADGGFVTTWEHHDESFQTPLLGQALYGPDGGERSGSFVPEFRARACQVAAHPRGGFTLTGRFETCGACGQRFDNQGRLVGETFDLVFTPDAIAAGRAGGLLSLTRENDLGGEATFLAAYDPQGWAFGPPGRISVTPGRTLALPPTLATDALGRGVVIWRAPALSGDQLLARRVGAAGQPLGPEIRIDLAPGRFPDRPAVALAPDGRFVVAWEDDDGDGSGILARRFDAAGIPEGAPFPVNSRTAGDQTFPRVARQGDGRFLILWQGPGEEGVQSLYAQYFSAAGTRLGAEVRVDPSPADATEAVLAANASGRYVAVWVRSGQTVAGHWWTAPP